MERERRMTDQYVSHVHLDTNLKEVYDRILSLEKRIWIATGIGIVLAVIGGAMLMSFSSLSSSINLQATQQASVTSELKNVKESLIRLEERFFNDLSTGK